MKIYFHSEINISDIHCQGYCGKLFIEAIKTILLTSDTRLCIVVFHLNTTFLIIYL